MGADQSGLFRKGKTRKSSMSPIRERSEVSTRQEIHETKRPLETTPKPQMTRGRLATIGDIQLENIDDDDLDDEYIRPDTPRPLPPKVAPPTVSVLVEEDEGDDYNNNGRDNNVVLGPVVSHAVSSRGSPSPTLSLTEAAYPVHSLPLTPATPRRITPRSSATASHKGDTTKHTTLTSNGGLTLTDYIRPQSQARIVTTTSAGQSDDVHALPSVSV